VLIHEILEIETGEDVFFAEESLADLMSLPVTTEIMESELDFQEAIVIGDGLGVALKLTEPAEFWLVLTDRYSEAKVLDALKKGRRRTKSSEEEFKEALVEYFAISLKEELFCENCPVASPPLHIQDRIERLEDFLRPILPSGGKVMEIGCGNGMATQSLQRLGIHPWTVDVDDCEICQALKAGYLDPKKAVVLDARRLDKFFEPASFDIVVGFMAGLIEDVNRPLWKNILQEASKLAKNMVIYTTYTEAESKWIAEIMDASGWKGTVIDNRDDLGIYDQWVYVGKR